MKKTKKIILLLDRSSSMHEVIATSIEGVNQLILTAKNKTKTLGLDTKFTFIGFSTNAVIEEGFKNVDIKSVKDVTTKEVYASGGTKMYDAVDYALAHENELAEEGDDVLFIIFSDGETWSDSVTPLQITNKIKDKNWTFAFVGANQNAAYVASLMGFDQSNSMEYESSITGTRGAFYKLSRGVGKWLEKSNKKDFFNDEDLKHSVLSVNGIKMTINMPEAATEDLVDGKLPPYNPVKALVVDEYPNCPDNWEHGSSKASSYFVEAKEGCGMWLDFNANKNYEYDIAAVISIQGVNPITGQPTNIPLKLQKYEKQCPLHLEDFAQDRFCNKCGFKWPSQNFISSSGSPSDRFWLDGFRNAEGSVRQYVFTKDTAKGVANAILGEDKVYAIGVAFYRSKQKKEKPRALSGFSGYSGVSGYSGASGHSGFSEILRKRSMSVAPQSSFIKDQWLNSPHKATLQSNQVNYGARGSSASAFYSTFSPNTVESYSSGDVYETSFMDFDNDSISSDEKQESISYEVGAGSKIKQDIYVDKNSLDYWEEAPHGIIYVNYTDSKTMKKIVSKGKRKESEEGFLSVVEVGR